MVENIPFTEQREAGFNLVQMMLSFIHEYPNSNVSKVLSVRLPELARCLDQE